jgi:hypothetical protein
VIDDWLLAIDYSAMGIVRRLFWSMAKLMMADLDRALRWARASDPSAVSRPQELEVSG